MSLGRLFQSGKSGVPLRTTWLIVCLFLHSAVGRVFGQTEDVGLVLEQKTRTFLHTPENFFDSASQRDLCLAILRGDLEEVEAKCKEDESVLREGRCGVTPLFWAYLSRQFECYSCLLRNGASPDVSMALPENRDPGDMVFRFREGDSVFYMTARNRESEKWLRVTLEFAKQRHWIHPSGGGDLLHAFLDDRAGGVSQTRESLSQLIKFRLDLDLQDSAGETPLMKAVVGGRYEFAVMLLKAGANAECYNGFDQQVVHQVARSYASRQKLFREYPDEKLLWDASQEKKDWDELIGLLRDKGFKLTDALLDLERAADPQSGSGYMYKRRLARQDRFCCGTGRKLQETLGDSVEELPPQQ